MTRRSKRCHQLTVLLLLALCIAAEPASATIPGQNGKIAFQMGLGNFGTGPPEIYTKPWPFSGAQRLTTNPGPDENPNWSPDGTMLAWESAPDVNAAPAIWTMRSDGSNKVRLTFPAAGEEDRYPAWSPDGTKILFVRISTVAGGCSGLYTIAPDGSGLAPLAAGPECFQEAPAWSPDGTKIAYRAYDFEGSANSDWLYVANADNSAPAMIRLLGTEPSWSPSGLWIIYQSVYTGQGSTQVIRTTPDGVYGSTLNAGFGSDPEYSPDGTMIALGQGRIANDAGTVLPAGQSYAEYGLAPAWQPLQPAPVPPGYPRPKGATPFDVSLVPAFERCTAPNTTHGPPLAFDSCSPPTQVSSNLTIGTPDANGQAARSTGRFRLETQQADVAISAAFSDVRCRSAAIAGCDGALADYEGTLVAQFSIQLTDDFNGGSGAEAATVRAIPSFQTPFLLALPCAATVDPGAGATCATTTSVEALLPNAVVEGTRATWELGRIEIWDAGEDGNPASDDNILFAVQGLFVP
jgi:Tol biopolymer transport system component